MGNTLSSQQKKEIWFKNYYNEIEKNPDPLTRSWGFTDFEASVFLSLDVKSCWSEKDQSNHQLMNEKKRLWSYIQRLQKLKIFLRQQLLSLNFHESEYSMTTIVLEDREISRRELVKMVDVVNRELDKSLVCLMEYVKLFHTLNSS